MHAALIAAVLSLLGQAPLVVCEQDVELISVAHLDGCGELVFFHDFVQGELTRLDHRWLASTAFVHWDGAAWVLSWEDECDHCYRVVRAPIFVESWEAENPLNEINQRPWFRQLLEVGLRQPPRLAGGAK